MNIRRYLLVQRQYGGDNSLAVEVDGKVKVIGDIRLPRDHETPFPSKETPLAAEARAKAEAEQNRRFCETVLGHLNAGLRSGAMAERKKAINQRQP